MDRYPFVVDEIVALAKVAGETVMKVYGSDFAVYEKADRSPVTDADVAAEKVIFAGLKALTPDIPAVGEEHVAQGGVPALTERFFWLVDPVDGTEEFVKRNGEFTVNIGLIDGTEPVFGVVYAPAADELYFTQSPVQAFGVHGGRTELLKTRTVPAEGFTVFNSRSHFRADEAARLLGNRTVAKVVRRGSSLKFCDIAAGRGDAYPCTHETHEWDTAAAHAVLKAAGGVILDASGAPLAYRKPELKNPRLLSLGKTPFREKRFDKKY